MIYILRLLHAATGLASRASAAFRETLVSTPFKSAPPTWGWVALIAVTLLFGARAANAARNLNCEQAGTPDRERLTACLC
jgi:hypothetical protein